MIEQWQQIQRQDWFKQVFYFDEMLTPKVIQLVYWFFLVSIVLQGLGRMFGDGGSFISGLLWMAGGLIAARLIAELVIVLFKLNDSIAEMARNTGQAQTKGE